MEPFQLTNMATALLAYPENLESRAQLERDLNQTVVNPRAHKPPQIAAIARADQDLRL